MTDTSKEAVERRIHAARCHLNGLLNNGGHTIYGAWLEDLIALLPTLSAQLAEARAEIERLRNGRVKPLGWYDHGREDFPDSQGSVANTVGGFYRISRVGSGWYCHGDLEGSFPTLETAKAAAQADYESSILSCLEPDPDAQTAYERGLRDALDLCELVKDTDQCGSGSGYAEGHRDAADWCIDEIESLLTTPAPDPADDGPDSEHPTEGDQDVLD